MIKSLTTAVLLSAAGSALAHPGHADQSIHLAEWLMGAAAVAATLFGIVRMKKKARRTR